MAQTGKIEIVRKPRVGLYPGTFDPVTLGHLDIVKRAVKLVDHLVIGVATNASKSPLFSIDERVEMMRHEATPLAEGPRDDRSRQLRQEAAGQVRRGSRRQRHRARPARRVGLRI